MVMPARWGRRLGLAAAFAFAAAAGVARGQAAAVAPAAASSNEHAIERARALIDHEMTRTLAPAVSVAVSRNGRLIWSEAIGCADLELQVPVSTTTRLRIGSVSKPLTSAALGALVEDGKLDLDAPVQRYVPDFPRKAWPITTRELAGHLAGIRHYDHGEFEIRDHYATVRAGLAIFEKDALLFEPGTRFSYSSYGWNLIAAVIEGASGERFLDVMQRRVFGPAGLVHTAPDDPGPIVAGRAHFYTRTDAGAIVNAGFVDNSYKWAGGGFVSTAEDLVAFANALLEGRLLKPETVTLLWTSQKTSDGKDTEYGMGWSVGRDAKGRRKISHSGGAQGGTAYLVIYPDDRLVAAMIVNSDESFTGRTPRIAEMFLDGE
jgi:serine beta-lactamase-like protein LACTB